MKISAEDGISRSVRGHSVFNKLGFHHIFKRSIGRCLKTTELRFAKTQNLENIASDLLGLKNRPICYARFFNAKRSLALENLIFYKS